MGHPAIAHSLAMRAADSRVELLALSPGEFVAAARPGAEQPGVGELGGGRVDGYDTQDVEADRLPPGLSDGHRVGKADLAEGDRGAEVDRHTAARLDADDLERLGVDPDRRRWGIGNRLGQLTEDHVGLFVPSG